MRDMVDRLDMMISETEALAEMLLFVEEEAEEAALIRLRSAIVALLHLALDRLHAALAEAGRMAALVASGAFARQPA